jgi:site-specific DNA-methyltransferase (adenine-specific)
VNADATQERGYAEALGGEKADLLHSDPPYCLLTRRRKGGDLREDRGRKIDHDIVVRFESVRDYRTFTEGWLPRAVAHCKPGAPLVLWTNFLGKEPILQVARALGYGHLEGEFVWGKRTTDKNGNEFLLRVYEVALVLLTEPPPPPSPADPPQAWSVVSGYETEDELGQWGEHPHHKPFRVVEPLLRAWSKPGGLVLDPFAGSGAIPVAALRLGRRAACLELVPEWARDVTRRLQAADAQAAGPG